jgi:hypothetical protein
MWFSRRRRLSAGDHQPNLIPVIGVIAVLLITGCQNSNLFSPTDVQPHTESIAAP